MNKESKNTYVECMFQALHDNDFEKAKTHLPGAKEELELAKKLVPKDSSCTNAITKMATVIQLVEKGYFQEARTEEVNSFGAFKKHVKQLLLDASNKQTSGVKTVPKEPKITGPGQNKTFKTEKRSDTSVPTPTFSNKEPDNKTRNNDKTMPHTENLVKPTTEQPAVCKHGQQEKKADVNNSQKETVPVAGANNAKPRANDIYVDPSTEQPEKKMETEETNSHSSTDNRYQESKKVSQAMYHNNPDIADLSDINRPTKLAERFSELYDNEWTEIFEELTTRKNWKDLDAIKYLLQTVQEAYRFCEKISKEQIQKLAWSFRSIIAHGSNKKEKSTTEDKPIPEEDDHSFMLIQIRKQIADKTIPTLRENFDGHMKGKVKSPATLPASLPALKRFAEKAVELTWWMCVQDPPVYMCPTDDTTSGDKNLYRAYTKSGDEVDFYVWPALRLYKDGGGVLMKGVVQFK